MCRDKSELVGGDILFLISCGQIISKPLRDLYMHSLVIHASDLPEGRGWSPYIWGLLEGDEEVTVSLLEAEDSVDTGAIWSKKSFEVPPHHLNSEIHKTLFETEMSLMDEALVLAETNIVGVPQSKLSGLTYYRKRSPSDSRIDPTKTLEELFNTIRVMDPDRYPAFFYQHGYKYTIELRKVEPNENDND